METLKQEVTQMNVKEVDNKESSELINREKVKDSPFDIITINDESFGVMGDYRITEKGTRDEIKKELEKITWNRLIQVIMILNELKEKLTTKTENK